MVVLVAGGLVCLALGSACKDKPGAHVAELAEILSGEVDKQIGSTPWKSAAKGASFNNGDSVKTSANVGFSLYTYTPGLNLLTIGNATSDISHVSFWVVSAPEPASWLLAAIAALTFLRRRK